LGAEQIFARLLLIAFFNSPCYETPKNAITKIEQNNRGKKKKTEGKKATFFVMSPDVFFGFFFVVLNSPCYETPKKAR
jgi:hypothetical protein